MILRRLPESELVEDARHVPLDRRHGHDQFGRDAAVGPALSHQCHHLALARSELVKRAVLATSADHPLNNLRVERRAAGRDAAHRVREQLQIADPLFQEIADAFCAIAHQFQRVAVLEVLRQHHDAGAGTRPADLNRRSQTIIRPVGRHLDIGDHHVGLVCARLAEQLNRVTGDPGDLETRSLEHAHDPLAHQRLVLTDDDSNRHAATLPRGDNPMAAAPARRDPDGMITSITPETDLERDLLDDPELVEGLKWGVPRFGHPEGRVADHAAAMIAAVAAEDPMRSDLRFLTLIHDSLKAEVNPDQPWSPANDHARFARRFAERYTSDEWLLSTLELHDEPYWILRTADAPGQELRQLLTRLPDPKLFARFIELDATNEGKDLTFLWWFRRELALAGLIRRHPTAPTDNDDEEVVYVKAFATSPEHQPAVARAAEELIAEQRRRMKADGEVLTSDDGLRVELRWRWHGSRRELIERDADLVRHAIAAHPIFADAQAVEARIFRTVGAREVPRWKPAS
jgi:hypothetical protein